MKCVKNFGQFSQVNRVNHTKKILQSQNSHASPTLIHTSKMSFKLKMGY